MGKSVCSSSEDFSSPCVYTDYPGVILLASGSLCRIPALSLSWAQGCCHIRTHLPPCLPCVHDCIFHLCHSACRPLSPSLCHMKPCVSHSPSSHLCEVLGAPPLLATPTPHFPCQERSNYTEISTEKDRLLLWHQSQDSCKSGAAAAAASGHCAGCRGALTSAPPPLCSISVQLPGAIPLPRTPEPYYTHLKRGRRPVEGEGVVSQKITHTRYSINVP